MTGLGENTGDRRGEQVFICTNLVSVESWSDLELTESTLGCRERSMSCQSSSISSAGLPGETGEEVLLGTVGFEGEGGAWGLGRLGVGGYLSGSAVISSAGDRARQGSAGGTVCRLGVGGR